ncbi:MAG: hypothetical protein ABR529_06285 [Actinomycetota bacterium]
MTPSELNEMFASGAVPRPMPDGFLSGRVESFTMNDVADPLFRGIARLYMPWIGKTFDAASSRGVNVLARSAQLPMRLAWPSYLPQRILADRIEAFPFTMRVAPGTLDPDVEVLQVDYDLEANPSFIVRRILDEFVQVDDTLYLGKVLLRWRSTFHPLGFVSLATAGQETSG